MLSETTGNRPRAMRRRHNAARRGRRASAALFWVLRVGWGGKGATAASADAAAEWRGRRVRFHGRRPEREV
eukprot:scaffold28704_cov101-Isochrysis_galbana.AAC.3